MTITFIPSPFYGSLGPNLPKRYIILHKTAGGSSAVGVAAWFQNPSAQVSAQYIVGLQGEIVQCVAEADAAWANGAITGTAAAGGIGLVADGIYCDPWWGAVNPNRISIAIEHVDPSTMDADQLTQAQAQASFLLIQEICQRWAIPPRLADENGGITGHFSIDAINKQHCPGVYPWAELFAFLVGGAMTDEEKQCWQLVKPIVINEGAAILKDWLARRRAGQHIGPPLENEHSVNGQTHQQCCGGLAVYNPVTGAVAWYDARGKL